MPCLRPVTRSAAFQSNLGRALSLGLLLAASMAAQEPAAKEPKESITKDPVIVDEKTEAIIKGALKYLASKQMPNGAWGTTGEERQHPIAVTGYTLMAFQSAGNLPGEGEFGKHVTSA